MNIKESVFVNFHEKEQLLNLAEGDKHSELLKVNGHFHTPFSFSAFSKIEQVFEMAKAENIQVLGINDFYTTDGYNEFAKLALENKIFPLFNIEFMALQNDLQEKGIRVNDPANPGRTYMSGKGLKFPIDIATTELELLKMVQAESNVQTAEMIKKLNAHLSGIGSKLSFDFGDMMSKYAKNMLRERHIAKAVRVAIESEFKDEADIIKFYILLFSGKELKADIKDISSVENEIRNNLLKVGGPAFVAEDPKAFLSLEQVNEIIIGSGGIPCYPVLLDDAKGNFTDFEADMEGLYLKLRERNIFSIELIPGRNDFSKLKPFVKYFRSKNFLITFGTEHNTPQLDPLEVSCRGGVELDNELLKIGYEGACIIAAHQYLNAIGEQGYVNSAEKCRLDEYDSFAKLGNAVIKRFVG